MNPEKTITVTTVVDAPVAKVWQAWTEPQHIVQWAFASNDWEAPKATNDVRVGGKFSTTMAAKDKSASFDFTGVYTVVEPNSRIAYTMDDGRQADIRFVEQGSKTQITESFEMEDLNPRDMQQAGWQAILDNFKKHVEGN